MLKWLKHISKRSLKEDSRKLGVNLLTAGVVGGFITRITEMTMLAVVLLCIVGSLGLVFVLFGIYKEDVPHA